MKFKDRDLALFWADFRKSPPRVPASLRKQLYRKMQLLDAARSLEDLRIPPGNRLEKLKGRRTGTYSIRVNDQWRLCFLWNGIEACDVELCDYH